MSGEAGKAVAGRKSKRDRVNRVQIGHRQSAASASSWLLNLVGRAKCREQHFSQNVCAPPWQSLLLLTLLLLTLLQAHV